MRIRKASKEIVGGLFLALHEASIINNKNGKGFVLAIDEVGRVCKDYRLDFDDVCSLAVAIAVGLNNATDKEIEKARKEVQHDSH